MGALGSVLLAPEGVNGTLAVSGGAADVLARLRALPGCADLAPRRSTTGIRPFGRLKVRLKREAVTMGRPGLGPAGDRVAPADWNAVLRDPGTVTIDVRNAFEVAIGTFDGALDPGTRSFGDFPGWWAAQAPRLEGRRVAMFCTGGIRCEKASGAVAEAGAREVHAARRRDPGLPGRGAGGGQPLARRMLRLRRPRGPGPWAVAHRPSPLPRLPPAVAARGPRRSALGGRPWPARAAQTPRAASDRRRFRERMRQVGPGRPTRRAATWGPSAPRRRSRIPPPPSPASALYASTRWQGGRTRFSEKTAWERGRALGVRNASGRRRPARPFREEPEQPGLHGEGHVRPRRAHGERVGLVAEGSRPAVGHPVAGHAVRGDVGAHAAKDVEVSEVELLGAAADRLDPLPVAGIGGADHPAGRDLRFAWRDQLQRLADPDRQGVPWCRPRNPTRTSGTSAGIGSPAAPRWCCR